MDIREILMKNYRYMKRIAFLLFLIIVTNCALHAQKKAHSFEIAGGQFLYDGKPVQIHSGEMHYPRVPKEYWRHRMKMMKAMGLNAVATYVFWNYHNTAPGVWDFKTGNHDLAEYIKAAQEEGLWVILRPGPYVCAEWEFGGYPWWLQNNKDLIIRNNMPFLDSCKVYIQKLAEQVKDLQVTHGGPIIMVQVENEFGSYMSQRTDITTEQHRRYYSAIMQMLKDAGFDATLTTSDGSWLFDNGAIPGVLPTANGEGNIENLKKCVDKHYPGGPYMVGEFYPGWIDHWGETFTRIEPEQTVRQTEKYLQNKVSFNFYMAHGGTNFGFTAGANYNEEHGIQPDITSYDYDAPISEPGWVTPKYLALRDLLKKYVDYPVPEIPIQIPVISLSDIKLNKSVNFFDWKKSIKPVYNDAPLTFEQLGQGSGYVLYSKRFNQPLKGKMVITGLRDYALVYVNGKRVGELNRVYNQFEAEVNIPFNGRLDILVENMGRINYGAEIPNNTKGITSAVKINDFEITSDWEMYKMPMDKAPAMDISAPSKAGLPALYSGNFNVKKAGDVFLDMRGWGKGIVFINGINIGRYWKIGPQQTLYLPGCWLKKGENEVVIFEQQNDNIQSVLKSTDKPILESLNTGNN
jgi:beta-galactosidase